MISFSPSTAQALPIQPAWENIQSGGKVRKLNLRDNGDGTWTYGKTGDIFHHTGKTHTDGTRVLETKPGGGGTSAPVTTTGHDPRKVLFKIEDSGKVQYLANTPSNRTTYSGQYLEMDPEEFAVFKGGGKRTPSNKVTDPVTTQNYYYDDSSKQFHEWDKAKPDRRGKKLSTTATGGTKSPNQQLLDRFGDLVDRRRKDRRTEGLLPFDVGTYKKDSSDVGLTKLSGFKAWTPKGTHVNRDHIPSGESLNRRGDSQAYGEGVTIAIPNPEIHQAFSPTYGGRQQKTDSEGSSSQKRVDYDRDNPSVAVFRDIAHSLDQTRDQDYSSSHSFLDLRKSRNRNRQLGGYRTLTRRNVKFHAKRGKKRGFDPSSPAKKYIHNKSDNSFSYVKVNSKTQGHLLASLFHDELQKTKKARFI